MWSQVCSESGIRDASERYDGRATTVDDLDSPSPRTTLPREMSCVALAEHRGVERVNKNVNANITPSINTPRSFPLPPPYPLPRLKGPAYPKYNQFKNKKYIYLGRVSNLVEQIVT